MAATSNLYGRLDVTAVKAQFLDGACAEAQCILGVGANRQTSKDVKNNSVEGTVWNHGPIAFVLEGKETYLHVEVQHRSAFNGRITPLGDTRILLSNLVNTPEAWYRLGLGDHHQYAGEVLIRASFVGNAAGAKEEVKQPEKPVESKFGAAESAVRIPGSNATRVSVGSNSTLMALNGHTGNFFIWNAAQGRWSQQPGAATSVAAGADGDMWTTSPQGAIYRFDPSSERFHAVAGPLAAKVVAGGRNQAAILDQSGQIHLWSGSALQGPGGPIPWAEEKDSWIHVEAAPGASRCVELGIGYDGALWAVHADKSIWRRSSAPAQWYKITGTATQVGVASSKLVVICNKDTGRFSRYDFKEDKWEEFKVCSAHSVDVAADGTFIASNPEEIWYGKCA